jgi:2-amino-4-hydroxy-6-hydroxymethyldihydropteridine diphosphokinase
MNEVYVGLGSNLGERKAQMEEALRQLGALSSTCDLSVSRYYLTKPMYILEQPDYLNAVCRFKTKLSPEKLIEALQKIERSLGQQAKPKNAPRLIDLDILFYADIEWHSEQLDIPHPRWCERLFVLRPLADLTDSIYLPGRTQPLLLQPLLEGHFPGQQVYCQSNSGG